MEDGAVQRLLLFLTQRGTVTLPHEAIARVYLEESPSTQLLA